MGFLPQFAKHGLLPIYSQFCVEERYRNAVHLQVTKYSINSTLYARNSIKKVVTEKI